MFAGCETCQYDQAMTAEEIRQLPTEEKVLLMEALWADMQEKFESTEIPQEHKALLDERRSKVETGEMKLVPWDDVKSTIGRR